MKLIAHWVVDRIVWCGHCFTMDCFFGFAILVDNMIFKGAVQWVLFTCSLIRCFSWFLPLQRCREEVGVASEVDHHLNKLAVKIIKWHLYWSQDVSWRKHSQEMVYSSFFFLEPPCQHNHPSELPRFFSLCNSKNYFFGPIFILMILHLKIIPWSNHYLLLSETGIIVLYCIVLYC